ERDVGAALDEARLHLRHEQWANAHAAVERAQGRLGGGGTEDLRERFRQVRADLDMVARLEAIRLQRGQVRDGRFDLQGAGPAYAEAFRQFDLDLKNLRPQELAARLRRSAIRPQLLAALDDWIGRSVAGPALRERLLAVVQLADDDPFRRQVRAMRAGK